MYAAERIFAVLARFVHKSFRLGLKCIFVNPALQAVVRIKQQVARGPARADQQCSQILTFPMKIIDLFQVGIRQDVHIVYQERFRACKESCRFFDTAPCVQQHVTFIADMNGQSEILVNFQKIDNLFSEMVNVDDQFGKSRFFQFENHMFQHGTSGHRN